MLVMGNSEVRVHPRKEFPKRPGGDLFEIDSENGYAVDNVILNDDVLTMILSHLTPSDLVFNCRLVCKSWCNLIDASVWKAKLANYSNGSNEKIRKLPWYMVYWILHKNFLNRNLIENPCGADNAGATNDAYCKRLDAGLEDPVEHGPKPDRFKQWKITLNGGNKFKVETVITEPEDRVPHATCFATSFGRCTKFQKLDLYQLGASSMFMDYVQPDINISEWFAGRWDCRAIYDLNVKLLDSDGKIMDEYICTHKCGGDYGADWREVKHTFRNYGHGVRYIWFEHSGVDEQFWAGHYGSKMTGAHVMLSL